MRLCRSLALPLLLLFLVSSCQSIDRGVVIAKDGRRGTLNVYRPSSMFKAPQPDAYWVTIEERDGKSAGRRKTIFLFRSDWDRIRIGDVYSAGKFTSGCDSCCGK
jgi:hypothetical protein